MAPPSRIDPVRASGIVADDVDGSAASWIPKGADLSTLEEIAAGCTACDLHRLDNQTVFGAGPADARLVVVGEQPGDREDRAGEPFVGPAGRELDRALDAVGIERDDVYVTNAVKHFKFQRRRKRRIHEKPNTIEIDACLPWVRAEVDRIRPDAVLTLGATAGRALIGTSFRVTRERGELFAGPGCVVTGTVHPSSIVRVPDDHDRRAARDAFQDDLRLVAALMGGGLTAALHRRTRDQLYARAQALDIAGRSSMDKATLVSAVAAALEETTRVAR